MSVGLRLGIASQTPLVRMKRSLAELESEHGILPDPLPLDRLERGRDYSVTPGGVARMINAAVDTIGNRFGIHGEWVTLANGLPRDLTLGRFRLSSATLPKEAREGYGRFKEMVWEAMNGLPPRMRAPLNAEREEAGLIEAFTSWSRANADRLLAADANEPFDVYYINDWQHLPQGRMLTNHPRVLHLHTPFADWTPPGWKDFILHHLRSFDAAIVSTRAYVDALRKAGFERPVYRVHPWIDPQEYRAPPASAVRDLEAMYGIREDDEVILNVGRMDVVKGQDRLVRAMPRLLKRRPNAKLVLVGNGSFSSSKRGGMGLSKGRRWRAWLEALTKDLGLENRVVFTGHLPHPQVVAAFSRADVFAFPSVAEGFGLAAVEAWLFGTPLVVSGGAGMSELVLHEENGLVADMRDPDAVAHALATVLSLPDGGAKMGEAGRATAVEACDVRRRAPEVIDILEAHAERRKPETQPAVAGTLREAGRR